MAAITEADEARSAEWRRLMVTALAVIEVQAKIGSEAADRSGFGDVAAQLGDIAEAAHSLLADVDADLTPPPPRPTSVAGHLGESERTMKLQIGIELTISDDDDPEDVLEDVQEALGWVIMENPAWQPVSVQILSDHDCSED